MSEHAPPELDLAACEREPIHIPGSVQGHGVLLAVDEPGLVVRVASANVEALLGRAPGEVLGASLESVLGAEGMARVAEALAREQLAEANPIAVELRTATGPAAAEAVVHRADGLAVVELEPVDGVPLDLPTFVHGVSRSIGALQSVRGPAALVARGAEEVRRLTGYERVLVYRFHPDDHGEVVAESRAPELEPFLGLHYPASDIPPQARALYLRQTLRLIADVDDPPARLWSADDDAGPLDLSHAVLRSSSPIHLQYLRNMGVGATMTISMLRDGRLWGLIACHHATAQRIPYGVRAACDVLGELLSFRLVREEEAEREQQRRARAELEADLVARLFGSERISDGVEGAHELLLRLVDADGAVAVLGSGRVTLGVVPPPEVDELLLAHVPEERGTVATAGLRDLLGPDAPIGDVAGALLVRLPEGIGAHIVWYRREWRHTVAWGGDPEKPVTRGSSGIGPDVISPRASFDAWREEVRYRSRRWSDAEVDAARSLADAMAEHLLRSVRDQLAHVALHDPLTGLANRTLLLERLGQLLLLRARDGARSVGVLFIDLDRFKQVNDTLGHGAGDALLREVGDRLRSIAREADVVARVGGDEFVVATEPVRGPEDVAVIAGRVLEVMRAPFDLGGRPWFVTASVGLASAELGVPVEPAALLRDADAALYEAKRGGRDRQSRFDEDLHRRRVRRTELENRLRDALERDELALAYQPIWTAAGGLVGVEALLRWTNPVFGVVAPGEFIPIAEEVGLIDSLGDWVLATAIGRLATLLREHPGAVAGGPVMSINLSARQLAAPGLCQRVRELLERSAVPAHLVWLEITESVLMSEDSGQEHAVLDELRATGVRIAIDDFGTGFSSLAYLRRLPVDLLKIDRAFVAGLDGERADTAVVASIIELARRLELRTVAEGIETETQQAEVVRLGCELLQGFRLARPLVDADLDALFASGGGPVR